MSVSCPHLGRKVLELLSLNRLLLLLSCGALRNRIMHAFTDGASKSLVMEYLLTLNKTKIKTTTTKIGISVVFFFLFHQMQPVDLLGITIKTLAEIEKEVGSHPCTKKCHEICVHLVVRFSPLWKRSCLSQVTAGR